MFKGLDGLSDTDLDPDRSLSKTLFLSDGAPSPMVPRDMAGALSGSLGNVFSEGVILSPLPTGNVGRAITVAPKVPQTRMRAINAFIQSKGRLSHNNENVNERNIAAHLKYETE